MILIILLSPHTAIRLESGLHADLQGPYPSSAGPYLKIYKKSKNLFGCTYLFNIAICIYHFRKFKYYKKI